VTGAYRFSGPLRPGAYRATAPRSSWNDHTCLAAASATLRVLPR
jgi:hypothetical protein